MPTMQVLSAAQMAMAVNQFRQVRPLVHCMTNDVVQNFTANVLLAAGASPAMVVAPEEVPDFVAVAHSLLINVGTIHAAQAASMLLAAETAATVGRPWVLDPVAVGSVLRYRTELCQQLLQFKPSVIRANASEILALAGEHTQGKGVDSLNSADEALAAAQQLARQYQTVVALTGVSDYITNGLQTLKVDGGDPKLTLVTGTGCALSALVAGFSGALDDRLVAAAAACQLMARAGEIAASSTKGTGSFAVALIDQLSLLDAAAFTE